MLATVPGLADLPPLRATRFIVTLYGDVVEPRGGALWMGSLIACCARQGISESLARTAVSRLMANGQLDGTRIGRKSYYRLTDSARAAFAQAARLFFEPQPQPVAWLIALERDESPGPRWAALGPRSHIAAHVADEAPPAGVVLNAQHLPGAGDLRGLAAQMWPLAELNAMYGDFCTLFRPLDAHLAAGGVLEADDALSARLQLVHRYRQIVLQDPRLPAAALPEGWAGAIARQVFARIYLRLSAAADGFVASHFESDEGGFAAMTEAMRHRIDGLQQMVSD